MVIWLLLLPKNSARLSGEGSPEGGRTTEREQGPRLLYTCNNVQKHIKNASPSQANCLCYTPRDVFTSHAVSASCTRGKRSELRLIAIISIPASTGLTTPWRTGSRPSRRSASGRRTAKRTERLPGPGSSPSHRRGTAGTAAAAATEGPWWTG